MRINQQTTKNKYNDEYGKTCKTAECFRELIKVDVSQMSGCHGSPQVTNDPHILCTLTAEVSQQWVRYGEKGELE